MLDFYNPNPCTLLTKHLILSIISVCNVWQSLSMNEKSSQEIWYIHKEKVVKINRNMICIDLSSPPHTHKNTPQTCGAADRYDTWDILPPTTVFCFLQLPWCCSGQGDINTMTFIHCVLLFSKFFFQYSVYCSSLDILAKLKEVHHCTSLLGCRYHLILGSCDSRYGMKEASKLFHLCQSTSTQWQENKCLFLWKWW